jgi:hypothetical protein
MSSGLSAPNCEFNESPTTAAVSADGLAIVNRHIKPPGRTAAADCIRVHARFDDRSRLGIGSTVRVDFGCPQKQS